MNEIPFLVTLPDGDETDEKGIFSWRSEAEVGPRAIPVEVLEENLGNVTTAVLSVLKDIRQVGQFKLKEVELQVEVSAEGGVQLIGTANLGGKGAITLKFAE